MVPLGKLRPATVAANEGQAALQVQIALPTPGNHSKWLPTGLRSPSRAAEALERTSGQQLVLLTSRKERPFQKPWTPGPTPEDHELVAK